MEDKNDIVFEPDKELEDACSEANVVDLKPTMLDAMEAVEMTGEDFKDMPFGVSGLDAVAPDATPLFEFTCVKREYDASMDAHHYHVDPVGEYGDLDFDGQIVMINGRERLCDKFGIVDGKVVITVYCRP